MECHCTICGAYLKTDITLDQLKSMPPGQMTTVCEVSCRNGHSMTIQALGTVNFTVIATYHLSSFTLEELPL